MPKRILATADIGGTNGRFAIFASTGAILDLVSEQWIPTANLTRTQDLLNAFKDSFNIDLKDLGAIVIGVAGPVSGHYGRLANADLEINLAEANVDCPARLINDFEAQAWSCLAPCGQNAPLVAGSDKGQGVRTVIGAGTGLGVATLIPEVSGWRAIPSEGGHMAFPFIGKDEQDFHKFLCDRLNLKFARGDDTITGRGLVLLHEFLTGEKLVAQEIGASALGKDTPTLQWYSRLYARACRNWMLVTLCTGGMWIAGGIAAQNPYTVQNKYFLDELYNAPEDYLSSIPLRLIENKSSGLWGAAYLADVLSS